MISKCLSTQKYKNLTSDKLYRVNFHLECLSMTIKSYHALTLCIFLGTPIVVLFNCLCDLDPAADGSGIFQDSVAWITAFTQ